MRSLAFAALAILGWPAQPAQAAPTYTNSPAAFATATGTMSFSYEGFNSLPSLPGSNTVAFAGFTVSNTFISLYPGSGSFCVSGTCLNSPRDTTFTFDTPVNAASIFLTPVYVNYGVLVDNVAVGTVPTGNGNGSVFVGVYDVAVPFTTLTIQVFGPNTNFDDLSFGVTVAAADTPEPASMAVLASGVLGLAVGRRKQGSGSFL